MTSSTWVNPGPKVADRDGAARVTTARPGIYVGLQYLRAIAAMMVVYFHALIQANEHGASGLPVFGRSGVDLFFVVSGFVMWTSTRSKTMGPVMFLRHRVARIVPLYWLSTLMTAAIALGARSLLRSTSFDLGQLLSSLAFLPRTSPRPLGQAIEDRIAPVVIPGWSLNFEMLFYSLFAITLIVPARHQMKMLAALIAVTLAVAVSARSSSAAAEFYGQGMLLEFLVGALIGRWAVMRGGHLSGGVAGAALLGLGLAALLTADWVGPDIDRTVAFGIPAAAIVAGMIWIEKAGSLPQAGWLMTLGDASYSIYLTHVFVVAAVRDVAVVAGVGEGVMAATFAPLCIAGSAVVGYATYRIIEVPLVRWARRAIVG